MLFKQREKSALFFFPLTFMATWLSAAEMIAGRRKLFCICLTVSTVCDRLGRYCPALPTIYLSNSGKWLEWSHPEPFTQSTLESLFAALFTRSKTALQQHKVHETEQVQQWEPGLARRGRESALKLQTTSWRRIFRNGLAFNLYFSILSISMAISLTAMPSSSKHWLFFPIQLSLSVVTI